MHDGTSCYRKQQRFSVRSAICWWISRCFLQIVPLQMKARAACLLILQLSVQVADLKLHLSRIICIWIIWEHEKWSKISNKNIQACPLRGSSVAVVLETEWSLSVLMWQNERFIWELRWVVNVCSPLWIGWLLLLFLMLLLFLLLLHSTKKRAFWVTYSIIQSQWESPLPAINRSKTNQFWGFGDYLSFLALILSSSNLQKMTS